MRIIEIFNNRILDYLACSANLPEGLYMYILPMVFLYFLIFFNGRLSSPRNSDANGAIFTKISGLVDGYKDLLTSLSFFWFFKGRCHCNESKSKNRRFLGPITFIAMPFGIGMGKRLVYAKYNSTTNATISCKILVKIDPVVLAENRLTNGNCVVCSRGSAYFVEYLWIYWTDFRNLFTIWKLFMYRWWICTLFSNLSRNVAMATKIMLRQMRK